MVVAVALRQRPIYFNYILIITNLQSHTDNWEERNTNCISGNLMWLCWLDCTDSLLIVLIGREQNIIWEDCLLCSLSGVGHLVVDDPQDSLPGDEDADGEDQEHTEHPESIVSSLTAGTLHTDSLGLDILSGRWS